MNRIDRLFGILILLQTKKYVSADKIADRFEISVRTVYRDIKALGELGIPLSFEPSKGYFIIQGYFLPPVAFTTEEANALLLMESMAQGFGDRSIYTHYGSALQKVKAVLKSSQKESLEILDSQIKWQLPDSFRPNYAYLSEIQEAITSKRILEITYKNSQEIGSKRSVEPVGLVFYAFNWHLIAWCQKRNEYRDFRVSRIQSMDITQLPFTKSDHISLGDYMNKLPVNY